jgi:hypothetical protein
MDQFLRLLKDGAFKLFGLSFAILGNEVSDLGQIKFGALLDYYFTYGLFSLSGAGSAVFRDRLL